MNDENPLGALILGTSQLLGPMSEMEEDVRPLDFQYAAGPDDVGIIATGNNKMDNDLVIAKILDAEKYAGLFPDWETRLQKSYILCEWRSIQDPATEVGWFARVRFVPVEQVQYDELWGWIENDEIPNKLPNWISETYEKFTLRMHEQKPDKIPAVVQCEKCDSYKTSLHVRTLIKTSGRAGLARKDDMVHYTTISDVEREEEYVAHVHCDDCGNKKHLHQGEFSQPS